MTRDEETSGGPDAQAGDAAELDALENELRDLAARTDPVPPDVVIAARAVLALRTLDDELAVLRLDSWDPRQDDDAVLATIRSGAGPRVLSFALGELTIDLEVTPGTRGCDVVGRVGPVRPEMVELEGPTARTPTDLDELGRFAARVGPGPVRLRAHFGDRRVVTPWVAV